MALAYPKPYRIARKRGPNHYTVAGRPPRVSDHDTIAISATDAPRLVYEVVVQPTLGAERIMARVFRDPAPDDGYRVRWYRFYDGSPAGDQAFGRTEPQLREAACYAVMAVRCLCANRLSVPDPVAAQYLERYGPLPPSLTPISSTWVDDVIQADPPCPSVYPSDAQHPGPLPSVTVAPQLVRLPRRYMPLLHVPRMTKAVSRMRAMQNKVFTCAVIETLPDGHALVYWYAHGGGGASRARIPMLNSQARKALTAAGHPAQEVELTPIALPQYQPRTLSPFEPWRFAWPHCAWLTRPLHADDGPDGVLIWHPSNRHLDNVERFAVSSDPLNLSAHVTLIVEEGRERELPEWAINNAARVYAKQVQDYRDLLNEIPDADALLRET